MSTHSVEFSLGTNNTALKTGLDQAKHQVESFKEQTHEIFMSLFAGIGVEELIAKFSRVKQVAEMFDTTSESVQRVDQLAQQFGSNIEVVARAMAKIRSGNGDVLEKLGIDAKAFTHAQLDQQLLMIAQALEKIDDPQERVNAAFEALGPRMKEILPLLNQGSEKIRAMMDGFSVASNETVEQLHTAEQTIIGVKNTVTVFAADIFGFVDKVMQSLGALVGTAVGMIGNGIGRIGHGMSAALHGDFQGVKAAFATNASDLVAGAKSASDQIHDIWNSSPSALGEGHGGAHIGGEGDDVPEAASGKERLSLAERLKALQEEHDRKQLDAAERLRQLAEERAQLELKLFSLGDQDAAKKKAMEDQLVANKKETLGLQDQQQKEADQLAKESSKEKERSEKEAAREAERAAKEKERSDAQAEKDVLRQAKEQQRASEDKKRSELQDREKNLGFASGVKVAGAESGQHLAGVNYQVVNAEAEKGIKLQQEMRDFLKSIDEKKWSVELQDAS
jgi:hypothetical protein